jgi:histidinol-phosphate/aromatic aminotransferase/cobyric acid decarboxylase-like protein
VARAFGLDPNNVLDLSQSLNPLAPDPRRVLERHLDALRRYPDAAAATAALAETMGVDEELLLLTNGGAEAIHVVSDEIGGRVVEPEFSLHPRHGGPLWRSNPHNPSGLLASPSDHAQVWDEAFFALATGQWTRGDADAVVVGSLTKLFGCPGLRIGYVLVPAAAAGVLDRCRRRQPEWSVNAMAASALPDLLATADLAAWSVGVRSLRNQLVDVLRAHGLDPEPSDANWVLVPGRGLRACLAPHGIVVRDCTSFGMPEMVRVAVPTPEGLELLHRALTVIERDAPDQAADSQWPPNRPYALPAVPKKGVS